MKVRNRILSICASIVLLLGITFVFVGCDDWNFDLESESFWGIDEASMRDPNSEFVTLQVGERVGIKRDVLMRKDVFASNPFFNLFTDTGYAVNLLNNVTTLNYLTKQLQGNLEVQYLRIGGKNYFYDFDDNTDLLEAALKSPNRVNPLPSNTVTDVMREKLKPTANATDMGGFTRKYFVIENQKTVNWKRERAIFTARAYGTQERFEVVVHTDTTFYRNVCASLQTIDTSDANYARVFGGVCYKNKWYLVHQI